MEESSVQSRYRGPFAALRGDKRGEVTGRAQPSRRLSFSFFSFFFFLNHRIEGGGGGRGGSLLNDLAKNNAEIFPSPIGILFHSWARLSSLDVEGGGGSRERINYNGLVSTREAASMQNKSPPMKVERKRGLIHLSRPREAIFSLN